MGLFQRSKNSTDKPPSDGPKEWAARAREVDAEVKRQRMLEQVGDVAANSVHEPAEHHELGAGFSEVEELSESFLRHLDGMGVMNGKFVRVGDKIYISPGRLRRMAGEGLMHQQILEEVMRKNDAKEVKIQPELLDRSIDGITAPEGSDLADAGKFDIYLVPEDKPREDGLKGRFRVFGMSASFGSAEKEGRQKTVDLAAQTLGENFRVEEDPHKI